MRLVTLSVAVDVTIDAINVVLRVVRMSLPGIAFLRIDPLGPIGVKLSGLFFQRCSDL
jgi:hypothetical protein